MRASARQSHCKLPHARPAPGSESAPRFNLPVPVSFFAGTQGASVVAAGEFDCGPVQAPRLAPAEHLNRVPLARVCTRKSSGLTGRADGPGLPGGGEGVAGPSWLPPAGRATVDVHCQPTRGRLLGPGFIDMQEPATYDDYFMQLCAAVGRIAASVFSVARTRNIIRPEESFRRFIHLFHIFSIHSPRSISE